MRTFLAITLAACLVSSAVAGSKGGGGASGGVCRADVKKFCGGRVQGAGAKCLSDNLESLQPECKAAVIAGTK
jgi:hypothetical protein